MNVFTKVLYGYLQFIKLYAMEYLITYYEKKKG